MRVCVAHVYWMLLFISTLSSGLLFLIVASENIQANKFVSPDRNQGLAQEDNVSIIQNIEDQFDTDGPRKPNHKIPSPLKPKLRDPHFQDFPTPLSASFENANKQEDSKIPEEIEILKESLSQQPNLSQGISDGGQPIVLTLVDTAATLQSLASGRTEFRPKSEGNASLEPGALVDNNDNEDGSNLVRLSELLEKNATAGSDDAAEVQVVVVRAEQKRPSSIRDEMAAAEEKLRDAAATATITTPELERTESETQQQQDLPKSPTTAPELNDSAARAQLTGSADDAGAAAILDSLVTAGPSEPHEDMPSFNEWAQKRLVEEAEKKKTHPNVSVQTANGAPSRGLGGMRMRSKNYASPDCGAKVVAATPESSNVRNILVSSRDEYMLNACTNRVWFVVELCEAIQARKIELANFELFSSSPKDLSVYVSDRFPTRDWTFVGQFTARDERDIQSFVVEPRLFGKFIKVELQSHYGSEHFCPISLFRAYGTSEFEALETETESDAHADGRRPELATGATITADNVDSEDAEDAAYVDEERPATISSNPLFTALRLLRKGAEMLIRSADFRPTINNITKIQESIKGDVLRDASLDDCGTPLYNIACRGCDDERFGRVFQLISCKRHYLESLISSPFIADTLAKSRLCESDTFGSDLIHLSAACTDDTRATMGADASKYYFRARFLSAVFTPDYIIALCNVLAAREQRLFANTSHQEQRPADRAPDEKKRVEQTVPVTIGSPDSTSSKSERDGSKGGATEVPTSSETAKLAEASSSVPSQIKSKLDPSTDSINLSESLVTQIKPTKTSTDDEAKVQSFAPSLESSKSQPSEDSSAQKLETPPTTESSLPAVTKRPPSQKVAEDAQESPSQQREVPSAPSTTSTTTSTTTPSSASSKGNMDSSAKTSSEKIDGGTKLETKSEESEAKQKIELDKAKDKVEQDPAKSTSQEQLNFEGFDLKDLELETNGNKADASASQQSTASTTATPQQKESVFQRLSNRIKTLERNMSLSSQYLEELSRRYKKQVEEMQRSLERAMTTMNEESRKGEERESKRLEEVAALRGQISDLTQLLDELINERNSWWRIFSFSALAQHGLFVLVDVVLVVLILAYCRRGDDDADYEDEKEEGRSVRSMNRQGKTYEIIKQKCNQLTKKPKKRRPSEIASQVTGTYDQLMIENTSNASKNSRKKKRKKDLAISRTASVKETSSSSRTDLNVQSHSRSASDSNALYFLENKRRNDNLANLESQKQGRPDSAPDNVMKYFDNNQPQQQSLVDKRVQILVTSEGDGDSITSATESRSPDGLNNSSALEDDAFEPEPSIYSSLRKKLSSPSFMKTALGTRSKRLSFSGGNVKKASQSMNEVQTVQPTERRFDGQMDSVSELEATNGTNDDVSRTTNNGFVDESDESRSSCATPTSKKKRASGLKKMKRQPTS